MWKKYAICFVRELPPDAGFVVQDREVAWMNQQYNTDFDAFFIVRDRDSETAWGMYGIVPGNNELVFMVEAPA